MKRILEIAFLFVLGTEIARASGGIGGTGSGLSLIYDKINHTICVPGRFDSRSTSYYVDAENFNGLQATVDSYQSVTAKDQSGDTRSYRVISGDQLQQVELIDRRAAARNGVAE